MTGNDFDREITLLIKYVIVVLIAGCMLSGLAAVAITALILRAFL